MRADHLAVLVDEHHRGLGDGLDAVLAGDVAGADGLVHDAVVTVGDDQRLLGRGLEEHFARPLAGLAVAVRLVEQPQRRDLVLARGHGRHDGHVALAGVDRRRAEAAGQRADQLDVAALALAGGGAVVFGQVAVVGGVGDQHDAAVGLLRDFQGLRVHGLSLQYATVGWLSRLCGYGQDNLGR